MAIWSASSPICTLRFRDAMRERMGEFSLTLHPEKTRLIAFGRHAATDRASLGLGKPEAFDFLGFTFIRGQSRRGGFLVKRKSRRDRVRAKHLVSFIPGQTSA